MKHFYRLGYWKLPLRPHPERKLASLLNVPPTSSDFWPSYRAPGHLNYDGHAMQINQQKTDYQYRRVSTYDGCDVSYWHRDTKLHDEIVLWSNVAPTEICLPNGRVVAGEPGEVIVFRNTTCLHRLPRMSRSDFDRRHLIRIPIPSDLTILDA